MTVILGIFGGIIVLSLITGIILTHNENKKNKDNSLVDDPKTLFDKVQEEFHDKNVGGEIVGEEVVVAGGVGEQEVTVTPVVEEDVKISEEKISQLQQIYQNQLLCLK